MAIHKRRMLYTPPPSSLHTQVFLTFPPRTRHWLAFSSFHLNPSRLASLYTSHSCKTRRFLFVKYHRSYRRVRLPTIYLIRNYSCSEITLSSLPFVVVNLSPINMVRIGSHVFELFLSPGRACKHTILLQREESK